ncbi:DNA-binding response regulator, OmpR family, contains REC and winged-helix (wHTH) domain [Oscillospiraceae bacterium]|nr:DNA-binding response regulator, OmpR family, contains REC and winged-helix (wHTH) domain [Oscillospiraceae bacterium]
MEYSVLIIDDEKELADSTAEYFDMFDLKTCCAYTAAEALDFFRENTTKLILLDINLGDSSGFSLCKTLRETIDVPILFISARSSDDDMVVALNIGGDDYITKPYSLNVLFAKVKAVLKRYEKSTPSEGKALSFGDIGIDLDAGIVTKKGSEIELTAMEYKLLAYLVENKNKVVPKQDIFDKVWDDSFVTDGTLNVHVRHLREKLEDDPNEPTFIKTARGRGYIFKAE